MDEVSKSICYFSFHGFLLRHGPVSIQSPCDKNQTFQNEINDFLAFGAYEKRHILLAAIWVMHRSRYSDMKIVETIRGLLYLVDCIGVGHQCTSEERKLLQRLTNSIVSLIEASLSYTRIDPSQPQNCIDWNVVLSIWVDKMTNIRKIRVGCGKRTLAKSARTARMSRSVI